MLLQISLLLLLLRMLVIMYELGSYSVAHGLHYRSPGFSVCTFRQGSPTDVAVIYIVSNLHFFMMRPRTKSRYY